MAIDMKRSPKLQPSPWDGVIVALVLLLAAACALPGRLQAEDDGALTVVVSADGEELERIPLTAFPDAPRAFSANGYTLYLTLDAETYPDKPGVRVTDSDCPTQDCVHTGVITRSGQSIVCLPAHLIITLEGTASDDGAPDLVVG